MNILEENKKIIDNVKNVSRKLDSITYEGSFLVYNNKEKVDISNFNLREVLYIVNELVNLDAEEFFKIIKIHCLLLKDKEMAQQKKDESENHKSLEEIKKQNPLMQYVTVFEKDENSTKMQYFSVIDSTGAPHVFYNRYNVDIKELYNSVVLSYGSSFSIDNLIAELRKRLPEVMLRGASEFLNDSRTSESFSNKMKCLNERHKDNIAIQVFGNQEHDICFINNLNDLSGNKVLTYGKNQYDDIVAYSYTQDQNISNEQVVVEKPEIEVFFAVDTFEEFLGLIESEKPHTESERKIVNYWYSILGDIKAYEVYLDDRVKEFFWKFEIVVGLFDDTYTTNQNQKEAIQKYHEMLNQSRSLTESPELLEEKVENVKRLVYDKAGNVSVLQIIWVVVGIAIILTAVTMYVIN